uniref:Pentatricopeptide repeat-containing protein At3g29230-like n=1 Tax=Rhizophora mucronata TaxID=61149 RepID=A0A2P2PJC5_RHIMU
MPSNLELKISSILPKCPFQHLKQVHSLIVTTSLAHNIQIFVKFLRRSTEFGTMDYPARIFSQMGAHSNAETVLWNAMIRGYAFNGPFEKCVSLFDEMPHRGLKPHNFTYPYVLNCCAELGWFEKGKIVHCQIIKSGFESSYAVSRSLFHMYVKVPAILDADLKGRRKIIDARKVFDDILVRTVEVWNRMMSGYLRIGDVSLARQLFDIMPERDFVSWNSMISGYAQLGEVENARALFDLMPEKNVVSWTSMVGMYANTGDLEKARELFEKMSYKNVVSWNCMISSNIKHGKFMEALDLFVRMESEEVTPDEYTFVSVLSACSNMGVLEFGKYVHYLIGDCHQLGVMVGTSLIEMYAQCGDVNIAFAIFVKMPNKDVFCWNVMIKSLAINSKSEDAVKVFLWMKRTNLKPNEFTFTSALFACSHGGLVEEGRRIFHSMEEDYRISPKIEHFGCLIDLLSRNGQLEEAQLLVKAMPFKPDVAIWGSLLGGCRTRNDLKLAKTVAEKTNELPGNESGVHVLLSNIHASSGEWLGAVDAREKMEEKKLWKRAGSSTIL